MMLYELAAIKQTLNYSAQGCQNTPVHFTVYSDKYTGFSEHTQCNFTSIRKMKIRKSPVTFPIPPTTFNLLDNPECFYVRQLLSHQRGGSAYASGNV